MRFLLGWVFKLGFLGVGYLAMTGGLQLKLPDTVLGYEVPSQAKEWIERNAQVNNLAGEAETSLRQISDSLK